MLGLHFESWCDLVMCFNHPLPPKCENNMYHFWEKALGSVHDLLHLFPLVKVRGRAGFEQGLRQLGSLSNNSECEPLETS